MPFIGHRGNAGDVLHRAAFLPMLQLALSLRDQRVRRAGDEGHGPWLFEMGDLGNLKWPLR